MPEENATTIATESFLSVHLKISSIGTSVKDKDITSEVESDKDMAENSGRFSKSLFTEPLKKYRKLCGQARSYMRDMTCEGVGSNRLLVLGERAKFEEKMDLFRAKIQAEVDAFVRDYDAHLETERSDKGLAFKLTDYPPRHTLASKFGFELHLLPVANSGQFQASGRMDAATAARLKANYDNALRVAVANSQKSILEKTLKLLQETAAALSDPEAVLVDSEGRQGPVAKLNDFLDRIPALNVTNDPALTFLVTKAREQLVLSTKTLKDSASLRTKTSAEASAILQQFQAGYGRKLAS